jgi:hypothetical protein
MKILNSREIQSVSGGEMMLNIIAGYNHWNFAIVTGCNTILALGIAATGIMGNSPLLVVGTVLFNSTIYGLGYGLSNLNASDSENANAHESPIEHSVEILSQ